MALFKKKKEVSQTEEQQAPLENQEKHIAKERRKYKRRQTYQSFASLFQGISGRWLSSSLILLVVMFSIFSVTVYFIAYTYFYNTVDAKLAAQYTDDVSVYFFPYVEGYEETFESDAYSYVSDFEEKDQIEVWVINNKGQVVVSSSGFDIDEETIPDYQEALNSKDGTATYSGKNSSGEHIRSATYLLRDTDGKTVGAVRYIISTELIRMELRWILFALWALFMISFLFVVFLSTFFVRSIVNPVRELNEVTKRIAAGDMDARAVPGEEHNEVTELAHSINQMADEVSSTDKMKNDFISTVSHEMKTPLTAIKGWAETLMTVGDSDPSMTQRGLEVIVDETTLLTGVVEDLLDLSKIVNGRLTLKYSKIDILAELDDIIFVFRDRSAREGIELIYNVPNTPAPANGDAARIQQVFVNILDNAFKYNREGGKITVFAQVLAPEAGQEQGTLLVQIEDTGCGISQEELPKVTQKFYKSNISVKGSGIGLAVCDEIIKMHHGTMKLESEVDVGTCVTVTFPIQYTAPVQDELTTLVNEEMENNNLGEQNT